MPSNNKKGEVLVMSLDSSDLDRYFDEEDCDDKEINKQLVDMDLFDYYFFNKEYEDSREFADSLIEQDILYFNHDIEDEFFDSHKLDGYAYKEAYVEIITEALVNKIYQLYVNVARRYVLLSQRGNFQYVCWDRYDKKLCTPEAKPLLNFMIKGHLKGWYTVCVVTSWLFTKFICFDIDIKNGSYKKEKAQKVVRLLYNTLVEYGIPKDRIYISWSGKKGYHVEIFFQDELSNNRVKEFFNLIIDRPGLNNISGGDIEFYPLEKKAIKLPLGINYNNRFKADRRCYFVDIHNGAEFEYIRGIKYFLDIEPIDTKIIYVAIEKLKKASNTSIGSNLSIRKSSKRSLSISSKCKNENKHEYNSKINQVKSESEPGNSMSVKSILKLEREGLKYQGTRHNSLLWLSIFNKDYYHCSREENMSRLIEWFKKQDESTYTTSFEESIKDIEKIVKDTYDRDYKLGKKSPIISIFPEEIEYILKVQQKNGKLLLFALLAHNKRYSALKEKFYMSYKQMSIATGLCLKTCKNLLKKLVAQNFIEVVESKIPDSMNYYKPNHYKLLFEESSEVKTENNKHITFEYNGKSNIRNYYIDGLNLLDDKNLKKHLPKKDFHLLKKGNYIKF